MMTATELMGHYKKVREEEGMNGGLGLITNPQAQVGGILLAGLNPSGKEMKSIIIFAAKVIFGIQSIK